MRVFKATYRDRKGEVRESAKWYVEFKDHTGAVRRLPADTNHSAAVEFGRKCERLASYRASHMPPDMELVKWLETLAADKVRLLTGKGRTSTRPTIAKRGPGVAPLELIEPQRAAASKPLTDHVADFQKSLVAKGTTAKQAALVEARVTAILKGAKLGQYADITPARVLEWLNEQHKDVLNEKGEVVKRGKSAQTFTFYVRAIKQFCRWMQRERRATENPIAFLEGLNARVDRRHDRRALTTDECRRLIDAAANGDAFMGMSGPDRAMVYRLALETGLRYNEIRSLKVGSFSLKGDKPTVTVGAAYSKRRREDVQPLRPELAKALTEQFRLRLPDAPAFVMPGKTGDGAKMVQHDLEHTGKADEAGKVIVKAIEYEDAQGRKADFHALRHTFVSNLVAGGVHPKTAQALARHSTITLTMDRYTHLSVSNHTGALNVLPDLSALPTTAEAKATGTEGATVRPEPPARTTSKGRKDEKDGQDCLLSCLLSEDSEGRNPVESGREADEEAALVGVCAEVPVNTGETAQSQGNQGNANGGEGGSPPGQKSLLSRIVVSEYAVYQLPLMLSRQRLPPNEPKYPFPGYFGYALGTHPSGEHYQ